MTPSPKKVKMKRRDMTREIYTSSEYGSTDQPIQVEADFSQAASMIRWRETDREEWMGTHYQVADAHHNPNDAIDLIAKWLDQ